MLLPWRTSGGTHWVIDWTMLLEPKGKANSKPAPPQQSQAEYRFLRAALLLPVDEKSKG